MGDSIGSVRGRRSRIDPAYFGREAETATLQVVWQPVPDARPGSGRRTAFDALFRIHYSEPGGIDCGFHNEPNPHVDGWFHVQWRSSPDEEYEYRPASLEAGSPVGALWEVLEELESMLRGREVR